MIKTNIFKFLTVILEIMKRKLLNTLKGKYPNEVVAKQMNYSYSSIPNAMGIFDDDEDKIGIGYKPDKFEGINYGIATLVDKFGVYPNIHQYMNPTGIWSYLLPLWFVKDYVAKSLEATQGFVGPSVLGITAGMVLKRAMLLWGRSDVLEHERRHAAHYYTNEMMSGGLRDRISRWVRKEEKKRYHNLEELITRTENLHDHNTLFNKLLLFDDIISDGITEPIKDISRTGILPGIIVSQANTIPVWYTGLMVGLYALSGIAPFTTRSQFPYIMHPVRRIKSLWNVHKFVDSYLNLNDDYVPILPNDGKKLLEKKKPLLAKTMLKGKSLVSMDESDVHEWLLSEYNSAKKRLVDREFSRSILIEYEKLETIFVPQTVSYDDRSIYRWAANSISHGLKKLGISDIKYHRKKRANRKLEDVLSNIRYSAQNSEKTKKPEEPLTLQQKELLEKRLKEIRDF